VKIILDGLGSRHGGRKIAQELKKCGVGVKIFRPRRYYLLLHPVKFLRRNHARIFLIDRKLFGLGGICIGKIYDDRQDLSVFLKISNANPVVFCFEYLWAAADGDNATARPPNRPEKIAPDTTALISTPAKQDQMICRWHLDRIKSAKKRIVVVSAWFLPANELLKELISAKKRGVDVTVVTPFHTDKKWYDYFRGVAIPRLLRQGVAWYVAREYFHQKFSIIDNDWCLGSANFDMVSMNRNYELNICGQGRPVLGELENNYKNLLLTSKRTTKTGYIWLMRWVGGVVYPLVEFFLRAN